MPKSLIYGCCYDFQFVFSVPVTRGHSGIATSFNYPGIMYCAGDWKGAGVVPTLMHAGDDDMMVIYTHCVHVWRIKAKIK